MPSNDKILAALMSRASQDQTGWQQEVKPAGMGVYGDDYWDKLAMRPEPELPQFSQQQQAPKGMLPADWDYQGELGPQGQAMPQGALGWTPYGEPYYGEGLKGWWAGLASRMSAPLKDSGAPLVTVKKQQVAAGQDVWSDFPSNSPDGGVQTSLELPSWNEVAGGEAGAGLAYAARGSTEFVKSVISGLGEGAAKVEQGLGVAQGIGEAADKAKPGQALTLANIKANQPGLRWLPEQVQILLDMIPTTTGFNTILAAQSPSFKQNFTPEVGQVLEGGLPFVKPGSDLDAAYQAGRMQYSSYIDPAVRAEFIRRYQAGESATALKAELENPLAEFAGQLVLDPLNFIGMGAKKARDASRIASAADEFVNAVDEVAEVFAKNSNVIDDIKAFEATGELVQAQMKASQRIAAGLDDMARSTGMLSLTADGRRHVVARRSGEILGRLLVDHGPEETLEVLRGVYLMASDNADDVAQGLSAARHATSPQMLFSYAGEELGVIMRRMMPDGPDKFLKELKAAQQEGIEAVIALVDRKTTGAIAEMFPDILTRIEGGEKLPATVKAAAKAHAALQEVYGRVNSVLANVYMGYSPGYAIRNALSNTFHVLVDEGGAAVSPFHNPNYWAKTAEDWIGTTPKGIGGFSGGTQGVSTIGKHKGPATKLAETFEVNASKRVVGAAIDRTMRSLIKEGRALPKTDDLVKAGLPRPVANRLIELIIQNKDVNKGMDAFRAEAATGLHELYRDLSWAKIADRNALAAFGVTDAVEDVLRTAGSREEALAGLDNILRGLREDAGMVVDDLPAVDPSSDTVGVAEAMSEAMDAGDIAQDAERAANIKHYTQANAYTMFTYEDALRQVRAERPNDPIWAQVQNLLDYKLFDGDARKAHEARKATAVAMKQQAFKKGFDLEKNWKLLDLPGEAPKTPAAFVSAVWDDYYFPYVRKVWENSRDSYVQAVEQVLAQVPPSDPAKLAYARKQHALAREWDKVLVRDSIEKAVDAAKLRGDNATVARMVAHQYGIASVTEAGVPMDKRILDTINKYLPEGQDKYTSLADVPEDVAEAAFINRLNVKAGSPTPPPNSGVPSHARALHEQMPGLEQLFNRLKQGVNENWGKVQPTVINRQIDAALAKYAKEANRRFAEARLIAAGVGNAARDFTLLSYPQKTGLDLALAYIYPYQFWYSRTYANWMKRLAYNPEVIAAYAKYKDYMAKIHAGAPEWWKYNINTNELLGMDAENPLFFNLEATLNPLNGLTGVDFDDPEKRVDWWTTNLDYLGRFGPSTWTPFSIVTALALYMNGEEEAAAKWGGRIVPQTAALKSAMSLLNVNVKTREGFNEFDPAVLFFSNGMDPFERRRVGRQLGTMVDQGLIDQATALDAARSQQGEVWDMAVQQAIKNRAAGQLSSFAFGVGFKARNLSDIAIDQFDQERRRLYAMKPDMSPEEYRDAWTQLKQKYPFADTVMLSRGSGPERDESYAFSVLGRIPPGQKDDLMELMGVSGALYDKFYDDKGNMSAWNPTDQQRFMAAVVDLGAILDLPDEATTREWNAAKDGYAAMQAEMRAQFGSDIQDKIDRYFAAKKNGTEAGEAVLQLYPEVQQALDFQAGRVVNSPDMAPYYSSIDKIERYYKGVMYNAIEAEVGADIWDKWDEYNLAQLDGTQRKYWREHPELKRYIELRDDYQKVIAQAITNVAGKLKSPVFPALRDADNLSTGQQAALDAIQNPAGNPYRVSWEELSASMSQPLQNLVLDYVYTGKDLPSAAESQLEYLAGQMGVDYDTLLVMIGNSLRQ
jgi:hypothetical protein